MVKHIGISFTLKGQPLPLIAQALLRIAEQIKESGNAVVLVHGFMPREVVVEKGFSTDLVDTLASLFPDQINCYEDDKPNREKMADILHGYNGEAYIIGTRIDGVATEAALYRMKGITLHDVPLPPHI